MRDKSLCIYAIPAVKPTNSCIVDLSGSHFICTTPVLKVKAYHTTQLDVMVILVHTDNQVILMALMSSCLFWLILQVLFCYEQFDELTLLHLREFDKKKLISVETDIVVDHYKEENFEAMKPGKSSAA